MVSPRMMIERVKVKTPLYERFGAHEPRGSTVCDSFGFCPDKMIVLMNETTCEVTLGTAPK